MITGNAFTTDQRGLKSDFKQGKIWIWCYNVFASSHKCEHKINEAKHAGFILEMTAKKKV